jgi:hypothetical protein
MPNYLLTMSNNCPINHHNKGKLMQNMPIDLLAAFVGVLAAQQGLSMLITNLETAAKQIEGRSTWIARDGTVFEEFAVSELEGSKIMQQEFEETCPEATMSGHLGMPANG